MREEGVFYLTFSAGEILPTQGETVTMQGFETWRITIKRIDDTTTLKSGRTMMRVSAIRELVEAQPQ